MLEQVAAPFVVVIEELEAEARARVTRTPAVNHASHGRAHVEPATVRSAERDDELFAGEDARVGFDEHALRRKIDADACDAAKIVLADDLAGDEDTAAKRSTVHFAG